MPHNPNTWPDWLELFQSWWRGDTPLGAVIMSIVMAGLRIAYFCGGGGWERKNARDFAMWRSDVDLCIRA
ncbi:phage holin family protein [Escherichia coli 3-475-03_S4_C2]|nr:phage holin family protein [Escherichia coli 3-475-03_S4_C2]